ncbi:MAG TPA: hypothetical protein VF895_03275 [Gaiellaceae bacterium]
MDDALRTRSARQVPNERARAAVLAGLGAAAAIPVGLAYAVWSYHSHGNVSLIGGYASIPVAVVLGVVAVALGRSARRQSWISLGRVGGERLARAGSIMGLLGLYLAVMALLALGFFGLLLLFD